MTARRRLLALRDLRAIMLDKLRGENRSMHKGVNRRIHSSIHRRRLNCRLDPDMGGQTTHPRSCRGSGAITTISTRLSRSLQCPPHCSCRAIAPLCLRPPHSARSPCRHLRFLYGHENRRGMCHYRLLRRLRWLRRLSWSLHQRKNLAYATKRHLLVSRRSTRPVASMARTSMCAQDLPPMYGPA